MKCSDCKHKKINRGRNPCINCDDNQRWFGPQKSQSFYEKSTFTNADRIRAMSDEALADMLCGLQQRGDLDSPDWWVNWLKQEVEHETNV